MEEELRSEKTKRHCVIVLGTTILTLFNYLSKACIWEIFTTIIMYAVYTNNYYKLSEIFLNLYMNKACNEETPIYGELYFPQRLCTYLCVCVCVCACVRVYYMTLQ